MTNSAPQPRRLTGTVVRQAETKTVRVRVERVNMHPVYKKQYKTSAVYGVHDPQGAAKVGDNVIIEECRPISATKRWRLVKIETKK